MSLAVLTPSRDRPQALTEMINAIAETADEPVTVYVGLDSDNAADYPEYGDVGNAVVWTAIGERKQLGPWTNVLLKLALHDGHDIIASFGDDHRPRTPGWDTAVRDAFVGIGSGLVYTRDGLQDERLPTAPFWSADVLAELGWFFPPAMKHLYCDDWWKAFAEDLGRVAYLPDVLIEHLHPSATGAEPDAINLDNDSYYDHDREAFVAFLGSSEYQDCLARVRARI